MTSDDMGREDMITITGTRAVEHQDPAHLVELFATYLGPFAQAGRRFFLGGARGIDTLALTWLAQHTDSQLTVVVPRRLSDQPEAAQTATAAAQRVGRVEEVVELAAVELSADAYHARNRWMVDRSDFVIGFPHGDDQRSGTWYTLRYAAGQDKPRLIVPV